MLCNVPGGRYVRFDILPLYKLFLAGMETCKWFHKLHLRFIYTSVVDVSWLIM